MSHKLPLLPTEASNEVANYLRLQNLSVPCLEGAERQAKPSWLKAHRPHGNTLFGLKRDIRKRCLHTVCEEAMCPNIFTCMNSGTATFMILGDTCTRGCRFCNVKTGNPRGVLDETEPLQVAQSVVQMQLDYVVLTMVDRDDLADGGAEHIAKTVNAIHELNPKALVEVLAGDFQGKIESLQTMLNTTKRMATFAHNLETVERCSPKVRDVRAQYRQSLMVLKNAKAILPSVRIKSGIMLGLGEELAEIEQCLLDMRSVGTEIVTLGQYLQPSPRHLPVKRYVHPEEFSHWEQRALALGFLAVASGPLVRSSYRAANLFPKAN